MWPVMHDLSIGGLQADALFASGLQRCDEPSGHQVRQAVATAIRELGYRGCAARVAQEFGDHPETAVIRMRWARAAAGAAFADFGAGARPASAGRQVAGRPSPAALEAGNRLTRHRAA